MILNDCSKICIDLEWCWTTVYWFPFFPLQEHDRTTKFFDCWCKNTTVQRFPSMLKDFERPYNDVHRCWTILSDSTTMFIDFHKTTKKNMMFFCRFVLRFSDFRLFRVGKNHREPSVVFVQGQKHLKTLNTFETFENFCEGLEKRIEHFHVNGCRISDHGLQYVPFHKFTELEIENICDEIKKFYKRWLKF